MHWKRAPATERKKYSDADLGALTRRLAQGVVAVVKEQHLSASLGTEWIPRTPPQRPPSWASSLLQEAKFIVSRTASAAGGGGYSVAHDDYDDVLEQ